MSKYRLAGDELDKLQGNDNLLTELQLYDYNNLGKLAEFLSFAERDILMAGTPSPLPAMLTTINPLPAHHAYQDGAHDVSPLYFGFGDRTYLFNFYGSYEGFDEFGVMALANHILAKIGSSKRLYDIKGFGVNLYSVFDDKTAERMRLDLSIKEDLDDEYPYDLTHIYEDEAFCYMLDNAKAFDIPKGQSLSSKEATDWLIEQKRRILAWTFSELQLPDGLAHWQELGILGRFRLMLNLFVALARHGIVDGRVVDFKYKNYPLMSEAVFALVVERLIDDKVPENKVVEFFLVNERLAVWTLHRHEDERLKEAILEAVGRG